MDDHIESIYDLLLSPPPSDPLSPITRQERRSLLIVSLVSIAVTLGGIIPNKISAFGIDLEKPEKRALFLLLGGMIFYFLFAFVIYAIQEYKQSLIKDQVYKERINSLLRQEQRSSEDVARPLTILYEILKYNQSLWLNRIIDFYVPVSFACISIGCVIYRAFNTSIYISGIYSLMLIVCIIGIPLIINYIRNKKAKRNLRRIARTSTEEHNELMEIAERAKAFPEGSPERQEAVRQFDEKVKFFIQRYERQSANRNERET